MGAWTEKVLSHSPALFWRFQEAAGPSAQDASGNGLLGTINGSPGFKRTGRIRDYRDGKDYAYQFSGSQWVDGAAAYPTTALTTFGLWFKIDAYPSDQDALFFSASDAAGHGVQVNNTGKLAWNSYGFGGSAVGTDNVPLGVWNLMTLFADTTSNIVPRMYLNGVLQNTPTGYGWNPGNRHFRVGRRPEASTLFTGLLDEAFVINAGLTAPQMVELYDAGRAVYPGPAKMHPALLLKRMRRRG